MLEDAFYLNLARWHRGATLIGNGFHSIFRVKTFRQPPVWFPFDVSPFRDLAWISTRNSVGDGSCYHHGSTVNCICCLGERCAEGNSWNGQGNRYGCHPWGIRLRIWEAWFQSTGYPPPWFVNERLLIGVWSVNLNIEKRAVVVAEIKRKIWRISLVVLYKIYIYTSSKLILKSKLKF